MTAPAKFWEAFERYSFRLTWFALGFGLGQTVILLALLLAKGTVKP